jgi:hypothetical protein
MRRIHRVLAVSVAGLAVVLSACSPGEPPTTGEEHAATVSHVHGAVVDPSGEGFLLGTHEGVFRVTADGEVSRREGSVVFDAMGFARVGTSLFASGHPGRNTPAEWGAPHLGIVRSDDAAGSWQSIAFAGTRDFHALTGTPDGTMFGATTDTAALLMSADLGVTWTETGAQLRAFALTADSSGRLVALTPDGVMVSDDDGATFSPWEGAPLLVVAGSSPDGSHLAGIDSSERIWISSAADTTWGQVGTAHGAAHAITVTNSGALLIVDDSGVTLLPAPSS